MCEHTFLANAHRGEHPRANAHGQTPICEHPHGRSPTGEHPHRRNTCSPTEKVATEGVGEVGASAAESSAGIPRLSIRALGNPPEGTRLLCPAVG